MSTYYRSFDQVPNSVIADRLNQLSEASKSVARHSNEFTMRIPAEVDRDADIVLAGTAIRLLALEAENAALKAENEALKVSSDLLQRRVAQLVELVQENGLDDE